MNFVFSLAQILLAAVLNLSTVKTASIYKGVDKNKNEVIQFTDVFTKSRCQPREMLVDISQEYPEDTEHTYIPSCVVLTRCGGCCTDEAMECVPTETRNVTLQVMRVRSMVTQHQILLRFIEHQKCDCRFKPEVQAKKQYHCAPCSQRRKRLFVQDPLTCKCSCKFTLLDCKSRQLELNERTCRCDKLRR
ncbi:vascular endothelial growth factor A-A-like isoform X2 [Syngnathoides biaculeatus]|uniref:vascular endothelial growth factor A-A-like isoform X2 n=1 Tax=Syngnathoides biaculeatus TaxID=300417 RepID=UPI002ADE88BC|nr:vascular endothelial growth factor A-A-like isoform X2 [Syngnathoides biaculeatus]